MSDALARGHRIEIRGFGSFSINRRPPRQGRNPRSGQVMIPVPHQAGQGRNPRVDGEQPGGDGIPEKLAGAALQAGQGPARSIGGVDAVRVHQHLLARADLASRERDRAQHALAQDYLRAGLFDRAEQAYGALRRSAFDLQARLALLSIHERARDWLRAADMAAGLDSAGESSYAVRRSHHFCEASLEADARGDATAAQDLLARAHEAAPGAVRPWVLTGQRLWRLGQAAQAMAAWDRLHAMQSPAFALVAADYVAAARACGRTEEARHLLSASYSQHPGIDLLRAWGDLDGKDSAGHVGRLTQHLARQPSLAAASDMLERPPEAWGGEGLKALRDAIAQAARPMQRYRCAACGFEAHHHFWQCPGCLHWDSYPPQRIEEL
jgi:lipopolysaccharide biosynthesis regulator YciM